MSKEPRVTQEMIDAYDEYTHLTLDRRGFMEKLSKLAGSGATAVAVLPLIAASPTQASIISPSDQRVTSSKVSWQGAGGVMNGVLARPAGIEEKLPAILVIHENRGLNEHIKDVGRRLALDGFMTLSADFLSPDGGTPVDDEDAARDKIRALEAQRTLNNARLAVDYLANRDDCTGSVGAIGFCWGGGLVNNLAVVAPNLKAAVAYYGKQADTSLVPQIKSPLMLHYAGEDKRINAGIDDYKTALEQNGKEFVIYVYEGVNHAFNNDTSKARYNKEAAELSWDRSVDFFDKKLK
ncbi:dienelactone hydrolase family protein [Flexibacterium corallicola]|uniref:dienelactone hydrolase family protein n=1 Tax=Flexibacterium corallicola TaxID=3037259 RepID=UPI00286F0A0B|nr:dienelactone hydrolase family protein [Pseudovibrio sp. M1P-2-3]